MDNFTDEDAFCIQCGCLLDSLSNMLGDDICDDPDCETEALA